MSPTTSSSTEKQGATADPLDTTRDAASLDRMARLRHLVRKEGKSAEEAAEEVGVDPIIAQLWLRLPDDLWPGMPSGAQPLAPVGGRTTAGTTAPVSGLRRVITCRVPAPAYDRLRTGETPLLEAAASAVSSTSASSAA